MRAAPVFRHIVSREGFTLIEVLMAALIAAIVTAGTMASFVAAARMTHRSNVTSTTEVDARTAQLLENFHANVAADNTFFSSNANAGWQAITPAASGSTSHLSTELMNSGTEYSVVPKDCNNDGVDGDCFAVTVKTEWDRY